VVIKVVFTLLLYYSYNLATVRENLFLALFVILVIAADITGSIFGILEKLRTQEFASIKYFVVLLEFEEIFYLVLLATFILIRMNTYGVGLPVLI